MSATGMHAVPDKRWARAAERVMHCIYIFIEAQTEDIAKDRSDVRGHTGQTNCRHLTTRRAVPVALSTIYRWLVTMALIIVK